jgi:hypothetical protein
MLRNRIHLFSQTQQRFDVYLTCIIVYVQKKSQLDATVGALEDSSTWGPQYDTHMTVLFVLGGIVWLQTYYSFHVMMLLLLLCHDTITPW